MVSKKPQHTFPAGQSLPSSQAIGVVPGPLQPSCEVHAYSAPPKVSFRQQTCEPTEHDAFFPHQTSFAGGWLTSAPASFVPPDEEEEEEEEDEDDEPLLDDPPLLDEALGSPLELAPGSVPACDDSIGAKRSLELAPLHAASVAATMKDPRILIFMTAEL